MSELWCMHIQGLDDLHAAPDFWTALAWAAELNSFIAEKAAKGNWKADDNFPLSQAVVRQWTGSRESHAVQCEIELADRAEHEAKRKAVLKAQKIVPLAVADHLVADAEGCRVESAGPTNESSEVKVALDEAVWELLREWRAASELPKILEQRLVEFENAWSLFGEDACCNSGLNSQTEGIKARKGRGEDSVHESSVAESDAP